MTTKRKAPNKGGLTQSTGGIILCVCQYTSISLLYQLSKIYRRALLRPICRVLASVRCTVSRLARLCQNIKKATNVFKRADSGPTPDRCDQHENARERTSTSGFMPMLGKWGFYNRRLKNERRTCQRHSKLYQSRNMGNVSATPQRTTQKTHTDRNEATVYETDSLSFGGRERGRSHYGINRQRLDGSV